MSGTKEGQAAYLLSEVGAEVEAERLREQARGLLEQELQLLLPRLPQGAVVADLGCGVGVLAEAIKAARPDLRVIGADADALAVAEAQRRSDGAVDFVQARLQDAPPAGLPLADMAVMRLVLMHQADPVAALRGAQAWIRPGGVLHIIESDDRAIVIEPSGPWFLRLRDLMQGVQRRRGGDRQLGLRLTELMGQAGCRWEGKQQQAFDLEVLGAGFEGLFVPVAEFYLREAVLAQACEEAEAGALLERLRLGCRGAFHQARVPLFHAWGRWS